MDKIIWTERLRNEVLRRVKENRNILHTINREKPNWIGRMLHRNCHLKHVAEGKIEERITETGIRGRRRKQLLVERRGYWILKQKALDPTLWRIRCRRDYGSVTRRTTELCYWKRKLLNSLAY
jgi:hypothetical protein